MSARTLQGLAVLQGDREATLAARVAIAGAADRLAATCRDRRASPRAVAAAERRLMDAWSYFGGLMLVAAARRASRRAA